jgi:hypothetical protein
MASRRHLVPCARILGVMHIWFGSKHLGCVELVLTLSAEVWSVNHVKSALPVETSTSPGTWMMI